MLTPQLLAKLWPHAPEDLRAAVVAQSRQVFARYKINTPLRVAHFMAQISHESDGGVITQENLSYRTAQRIAEVWPKRFTVETAAEYTNNARKLASKVYNGRMGNRAGTDDGFTYRGRGLLQITGRDSYRDIGAATGLDLEDDPDKAFQPQYALEVAAAEFAKLGCLSYCDKDDLRGVTLRVNGGYIGLDSRRVWLARWKQAMPDMPGDPEVAEDNERTPRGDRFDSEETPVAVADSKIMTTAISGGAIATLSQANEIAEGVKAAKGNVQELGIMDALTHVTVSPRLVLALIVVAAFVAIFLFRRQNAKRGV
jgi:putative chitinase